VNKIVRTGQSLPMRRSHPCRKYQRKIASKPRTPRLLGGRGFNFWLKEGSGANTATLSIRSAVIRKRQTKTRPQRRHGAVVQGDPGRLISNASRSIRIVARKALIHSLSHAFRLFFKAHGRGYPPLSPTQVKASRHAFS